MQVYRVSFFMIVCCDTHTGTGKTTMTIALLSILASTCSPRAFVHGGAALHDAAHVQRLLCAAPTNVAVQEIATRFVHTFLEGQSWFPTLC